jgi:solute carrier family 35 (probable UDP-sugar transporter), member A4
VALFLLFLAGILYSFGNLKTFDNSNPTESLKNLNEIYITTTGLIMILIYSTLSGLSGVYSEYLFKKNFNDLIFLQNIYLYIYGCLLNFIGFLIQSYHNDEHEFLSLSSFFNGFSFYTWVIVLTQVLNGIAMSVVMKYSSNITRLFVISSALFVTTFLSFVIFSTQLNVYYYISFFTILVSFYLYYYSK